MRISEIPAIADRTAYIVGTGPSLRCLNLDYFRGKFVIGVNQAWKHLPCSLSVTVHPELVQEYEKATHNRTQWVVKKKPPMAELELSDPRYYVFHTNDDLKTVTSRPADTLYLGEGAQTTAMDLAARLGATTIFLVGCDAKALRGDFHAHDQHVRWLGIKPDQQYALYRKRTAQVRWALRPLGVSVMTLSPFIGTDAGEEDYVRLYTELKLAPMPKPKDISPYKRKLPKK